MGNRVDVGAAADWKPGQSRILTVNGREICVVRSADTYYAVNNACPHQGADLGKGTVGGTMIASRPQEYSYGLDGCVLRCPWHGWEFDLRSGDSLFDPQGLSLRTYSVEVVGDRLMLET
jgi:nitrite reductase (NADH) small subunit